MIGATPDFDTPGVVPVDENTKLLITTEGTGTCKRAVTLISPTTEKVVLDEEEESVHLDKKTINPSQSDNDLVSQ